eukprot:8336802-Karenia_brevis.AAC.1
MHVYAPSPHLSGFAPSRAKCTNAKAVTHKILTCRQPLQGRRFEQHGSVGVLKRAWNAIKTPNVIKRANCWLARNRPCGTWRA